MLDLAEQVIYRDGAPAADRSLADHHYFHPESLRYIHPRINIGWIFDGGGDDAIAGAPIDAVGDGGDAFAGVFYEGDFFALAVDQFRGRDSQFFNIPIPAAVNVSDLLCLLRVFSQGVGRRSGQRADTGMVEEIPLPEDGKAVGIANEGADH